MKAVTILPLLLLCAVCAASGKDPVPTSQAPAVPGRLGGCDTLTGLTERNLRLYDTIQARYSQRGLTRLLCNTLFVRREAASHSESKAVDESRIYTPYEGKRISRIVIYQRDLISSDSLWIERLANSLHVKTRERVIRRDLLIREGDILNPEMLTRNNYHLQQRPYISDVETLVSRDPSDPDAVVVSIIALDSWSIGADADISASGRTMLSLYDVNFMGTGSRLGVAQNFTWNTFDYGGTMADMNITNVRGTFFEARLEAGKRFENSVLGIEVRKNFMLPSDYIAGASWYDRKQLTYMIYADSSMRVSSRTLDIWSGGSHYIKGIKSSVYLTGRFTRSDFSVRPEVSRRFNPAFHDSSFWIAGLGLYRERFYTANLIYGFGQREYLPVGYRAELNAGRLEGEFEDEWYAGASYSLGGFNSLGYLMAGISAGNYIDHRLSAWGRGAVEFQLNYFTNLLKAGRRSSLRQFVSLSCLQGWNRFDGNNELVRFADAERLRGMDLYVVGVNRSRLSLETVWFTRYQPLGFSLAVFAFSDMGLLGYDPSPFRNDFYSTVGIGVRLKNEGLVFKAVELRLAVAMNRNGFLESDYFRVSAQNRIEPVRFTPTAPEVIPFR